MSTRFIHKHIFLNLQARRLIEEQQLQQDKQRQAREQHVSHAPHIPSFDAQFPTSHLAKLL